MFFCEIICIGLFASALIYDNAKVQSQMQRE